MLVRKFLPVDVERLNLQPEQKGIESYMTQEAAMALSIAGPAFTVESNNSIIACIGVVEHHANRAEAWALLSENCGPYLRRITVAVFGWLRQCQYARVEANVAIDFNAGHKWAKLLGFEQEGQERKSFFHDGRSAITYVRLNNG